MSFYSQENTGNVKFPAIPGSKKKKMAAFATGFAKQAKEAGVPIEVAKELFAKVSADWDFSESLAPGLGGAAIGGGLGALAGYKGTEDPEKKKRNAILAGLLGVGLGGTAGAVGKAIPSEYKNRTEVHTSPAEEHASVEVLKHQLAQQEELTHRLHEALSKQHLAQLSDIKTTLSGDKLIAGQK